MKAIKLLAIFAVFLFIAESAIAAEYYVRAGVSGNGSDWANAYGSLPATLVRGATYYIADGSYPGYTFDDPNSGTSVITIKKAVPTGTVNADYPSGMTAAQAHGTDTGWSDAYGDGQAVFSGDFIFVTNYFIVDGQKRDESNWSSKSNYGISIPGVYENSFNAAVGDNITLRYLDIGPDDGNTNLEGYGGAIIYIGGFTDIAQNWIVERNYIHNGRVLAQHAGVHNMLYQYNWFAKNWSKTGIRHQIRGSSVVIRYNVFKNTCQGNVWEGDGSCTSIVGWYGNAGSINEDYSNSKVYGNVFWDTIGTVFYSQGVITMGDDRTSQGGGPQNCANCAAFNNTLVGMGTGACGFYFDGTITNSEVRNNMWYDLGVTCTKGCTAAACSNNVSFTASSSGMFVNAAGGNFRLSSDGAAGTGYSLSSPYNTDMDGKTRGSGTWDIGAYEFSSGSIPLVIPGMPGPLR